LLALGGVGLALRPGADIALPGMVLQVLTPRQYIILAAVADRLCPGGPGRPSASDVGVASKVDALMALLHEGDAAELCQGLMLIENALVGLLLDGRPTPFTLLGPTEQDAVLHTFRTSRIPIRRTIYKALRGLVAASYWGDPLLYASSGYPGPPDYRAAFDAAAAETAAAAEAAAAPVPALAAP
jgi:hypothetical protein